MKKTTQEIEQLKEDWLRDPCWDIEDTEGFEEHKTELYIFRLEIEKKRYEKRLEEIRIFKKILHELFPALVKRD
jgi:hypothetical protein